MLVFIILLSFSLAFVSLIVALFTLKIYVLIISTASLLAFLISGILMWRITKREMTLQLKVRRTDNYKDNPDEARQRTREEHRHEQATKGGSPIESLIQKLETEGKGIQ